MIYLHQISFFLKVSCSNTVLPSFPVLDKNYFLVFVSNRNLSMYLSTFQGDL